MKDGYIRVAAGSFDTSIANVTNNSKNIIKLIDQAYQKFLTPFLNYNVYIDDPYDLVDGIYQPLRLTEYLKKTQ